MATPAPALTSNGGNGFFEGRFRLDAKIILLFVAQLIAGAVAYGQLQGRVSAMQDQLNRIENRLDKVTTVEK